MKKFATYDTDLGFYKIEYENNAVTFLKKIDTPIFDYGVRDDFTNYVYNEVIEYLQGVRKVFSFKYHLEGTTFQKKVWRALCEIPYGETRSYKDIAIAVGNPKASRAIGMANNKNPITIAIPCHRVIGSNGSLVGYAGGVQTKIKLLEIEKNNK